MTILFQNRQPNKPKFCRYFNPLASHAIIIVKLKIDNKIIGDYPLFIKIRDSQSGDILQNIELKWLGPTLGYRQGREYALAFKGYRLDGDKHLVYIFLLSLNIIACSWIN